MKIPRNVGILTHTQRLQNSFTLFLIFFYFMVNLKI